MTKTDDAKGSGWASAAASYCRTHPVRSLSCLAQVACTPLRRLRFWALCASTLLPCPASAWPHSARPPRRAHECALPTPCITGQSELLAYILDACTAVLIVAVQDVAFKQVRSYQAQQRPPGNSNKVAWRFRPPSRASHHARPRVVHGRSPSSFRAEGRDPSSTLLHHVREPGHHRVRRAVAGKLAVQLARTHPRATRGGWPSAARCGAASKQARRGGADGWRQRAEQHTRTKRHLHQLPTQQPVPPPHPRGRARPLARTASL
jgi:hypothetical protein